jgi:hypothetical protein
MEREEWLGSNGVHLWGTLALPDEVETSLHAKLLGDDWVIVETRYCASAAAT